MALAPTSLFSFAAVALGCVWFLSAYARDLSASRRRLDNRSRIAATRCGPVEHAEEGSGMPLLVVHGAGGGFDQGMEIAEPLRGHGLRVIAMSRFGYLRTPLPADASPAAQADAHAALLDSLGIARAAIMGISAGGPSAMQFAIRHPDRCLALLLLVPLAYRPTETASSAPARSPLATKLLTALVGSDIAYWLAAKLARNLVTRLVLGTPPEDVRRAGLAEQARLGRMLDHILPISARTEGLLNEARIVATLRRFELEAIRAPTLILGVRNCGYGTFAGAHYTASQITGAKFVFYEEGGHLFVGHNDAVMTEILSLLGPVQASFQA